VPRRPRCAFLAAALAFLPVGHRAARAADAPSPRSSSLSWVELRGAESCGGALQVSRLVEERLGRHALVPPSGADLSIEAYVDHGDASPAWSARIVVRDAGGAILGEREITSDERECDELRSSAALVIALLIDPDAVARTARPVHPAPGTRTAAVAPPVDAASSRTAGPTPTLPTKAPEGASPPVERPVGGAPDRGWAAEGHAGPTLGFGFLPSVSLGAALGVTLRPPHFWRARVHGGAFASQHLLAPGGGSTALTLVYAGLALCPFVAEDSHRRSFELCGGGVFGSLGSRGAGFEVSRAQSSPFVAVLGDASLVVPLVGPLAAQLGASFGASARRNHVVYHDASGGAHDVYASPLFVGTTTIGLSVILP
jgi:hypothetical protein